MSKHIILVAGPVTHTLSQDVTVNVGGAADFTRAQWLATDLKTPAAQCAKLSRELNIDPVIRVGASASGYASLTNNSGITDNPNTIKNFPWDVFSTNLQKAYANPQELPVQHTYSTELDAQVEAEAIQGGDDALTKVISVAAGDDEVKAEHAKEILAEVPPAELEEWNATHAQAPE